MARLPTDRTPFDPAKAARDRNNQERPATPLTEAQQAAQRTIRKPGLRPLPPAKG